MKTQAVMLDGAGLQPPAVEDVAVHRTPVTLDDGALAVVRRNRQALDEDRPPADDIEALTALVAEGALAAIR
jgi:histidine ammonia-lyase